MPRMCIPRGGTPVCAVVAALFVCGCESQVPAVQIKGDLRKVRRVAVLPFADAPGADAGHSGRVVSGLIVDAAMSVKGWTLVERERLAEVLREQGLSQSDLVNPDTAIRIGKITGADAVVFGQVGQYRIGSIPFLFMVTWDQDVYKVSYAIRMVSVETSEILMTARCSRESMTSFEHAASEGAAGIFTAAIANLARAEAASQ